MRAVDSVGDLAGALLRPSADPGWEAVLEAEPDAGEPAPEAGRALGEPLREETRLNFIGKLAARDDTIRMAVTGYTVSNGTYSGLWELLCMTGGRIRRNSSLPVITAMLLRNTSRI
jgi:hypothetical protein